MRAWGGARRGDEDIAFAGEESFQSYDTYEQHIWPTHMGKAWGAATHMSISGSTRSNLRDFYIEMHEPDEHDE